MKYDGDELAEAALFLAQHDDATKMPAALEEKILTQGRAVASEVRFTTTKSAAVVLEEPLDEPAPVRPSAVRTWGGWIAAAACFAFAVYEWRLHVIERGEQGRVSASADTSGPGERTRPIAIPISSEGGGRAGSLRWDEATTTWQITIEDLAPVDRAEHYRVWVSPSDAAHAILAGAFDCAHACRQQTFALRGSLPRGSVKRVWVTRNALADVAGTLDGTRIVGEGTDEVP